MTCPVKAAAVLICAFWAVSGSARLSATTITEYDRITDQRAKSTLLARVITTVTATLVKELSSPRDASNRMKPRETAARDQARAALVPKAVTGTLGAGSSADRIGLLAVHIAVARNQNPATHLENIVRTWILDEVNAFETRRSAGAKPSSP